MTHLRRAGLSALGVAVSALMIGCSSSASEDSRDQPARSEVTVTVTIAGGKVSPTNTRTQAQVSQPIVLRVDSDTDDELHVHSDPSHTFPVEPKAGQEFRFSIDVPGQVAVELHRAGKTVTTLQVRP